MTLGYVGPIYSAPALADRAGTPSCKPPQRLYTHTQTHTRNEHYETRNFTWSYSRNRRNIFKSRKNLFEGQARLVLANVAGMHNCFNLCVTKRCEEARIEDAVRVGEDADADGHFALGHVSASLLALLRSHHPRNTTCHHHHHQTSSSSPLSTAKACTAIQSYNYSSKPSKAAVWTS